MNDQLPKKQIENRKIASCMMWLSIGRYSLLISLFATLREERTDRTSTYLPILQKVPH